MRCPDCQKFTSMEEPQCEWESGPDVEASKQEDGSFDISVTGSVRVVRNCADCSTELKTATLEMDDTITITAEEAGADTTEEDFEVDADDPEGSESGGGRYKKNMIGATVAYRIKTGDKTVYEGTWQDSIPASQMDEAC